MIYFGLEILHKSFQINSGTSTCSESSYSSTPEDLLPITKIPNTNLFTGIFYKLVLKSLPQGLVTWANRGTYYAQYELTPSELPKYETGGPYQFDNQWVFGATESKEGYTLTNRGKPFGNLIWVNAEVGHGNHVAIYDELEARLKMSEAGEWRKDASWIVQPTCERNYYKIENLAKRSNYLTWTWTKHNDFNYYIQLCKDFEDESKFSFEPIGIKLDANVYDFEFSKSLDYFLNNNESDYNEEIIKTISNPSNFEVTFNMEEIINTKDSIAISFKQSLTAVDKTTLSISVLQDIGISNFSLQGAFEANVEKQTEIAKTTTVRKQILISPRKTVDTGIFTVWAKNVELPFSAKVKIVGRTDRIVVDQPDVIRQGSVPPEFVEQFINSSGSKNIEFISRCGSDAIIVRVSGVLRGNFALKTIVRTRSTGRLFCVYHYNSQIVPPIFNFIL